MRFLTLFVLILIFGSCEKKENKKRRDALLNRQWRLVELRTSGVVKDMQECESDNFTDFVDNGTFIVDFGVVQCHSAEPQTDTFSWAMTDDAQTLYLGPANVKPTTEFEILELDEHIFKYRTTKYSYTVYTHVSL